MIGDYCKLKANAESEDSKRTVTIHKTAVKRSQLDLGLICNACGEKFECTNMETANEILRWWNFCPICGRKFDNT